MERACRLLRGAGGGRRGASTGPSWERRRRLLAKRSNSTTPFPDAHRSRAALYLFDTWEWQKAEAELRRALELDPKDSEAHHLYSYVLFVTQRPEEALQEQKLATALDYSLRPWALGHAYIHLRRFDDAIKELRALSEGQPNDGWVRFLLSQAYWLKACTRNRSRNWKEASTCWQSENGRRGTPRVCEGRRKGGRSSWVWTR